MYVLLGAAAALSIASPSRADILFSNGPIVTNPTGGTGSIAGLPISQADGFTIPGQSFIFSTTGVGAAVSSNTSVAENFIVPAGGWNLDSVMLFAFQTSQTAPSIANIRINLWPAAPFSVDSPTPGPVVPPLLATPLTLPAGPGTLIAHRESPSGTSTVRPIFAYTVSLDALPNGGLLAPGEYWLEWSFDGPTTPSPNIFTPLVTPRTSAFDLNARQFNALDGQAASPRVWFEGREGFVSGVSDGRPFALPFVLNGTPTPSTGLGIAAGLLLTCPRRRCKSLPHRL